MCLRPLAADTNGGARSLDLFENGPVKLEEAEKLASENVRDTAAAQLRSSKEEEMAKKQLEDISKENERLKNQLDSVSREKEDPKTKGTDPVQQGQGQGGQKGQEGQKGQKGHEEREERDGQDGQCDGHKGEKNEGKGMMCRASSS